MRRHRPRSRFGHPGHYQTPSILKPPCCMRSSSKHSRVGSQSVKTIKTLPEPAEGGATGRISYTSPLSRLVYDRLAGYPSFCRVLFFPRDSLLRSPFVHLNNNNISLPRQVVWNRNFLRTACTPRQLYAGRICFPSLSIFSFSVSSCKICKARETSPHDAIYRLIQRFNDLLVLRFWKRGGFFLSYPQVDIEKKKRRKKVEKRLEKEKERKELI